MNARRYGLLAGLLIGAVLLAFVLIGPARNFIIIPVVRLFWILKGIYGSFEQEIYWVFLLVIVIAMLGFVLIGTDLGRWIRTEPQRELPGDVQRLASWIARSRKSIFSRWHLARRLADLSLEIIESWGTNVTEARKLIGPDWNPPHAVQEYLETALRTSYADFSHKKTGKTKSSLDGDINVVVEYLESLVESEHDHSN